MQERRIKAAMAKIKNLQSSQKQLYKLQGRNRMEDEGNFGMNEGGFAGSGGNLSPGMPGRRSLLPSPSQRQSMLESSNKEQMTMAADSNVTYGNYQRNKVQAAEPGQWETIAVNDEGEAPSLIGASRGRMRPFGRGRGGQMGQMGGQMGQMGNQFQQPGPGNAGNIIPGNMGRGMQPVSYTHLTLPTKA